MERSELIEKLRNKILTKNEKANQIFVPYPEKEKAKEQGAKWDPKLGYTVVYSDNFQNHPLYKFRVDNFVKLPNNIPYELRSDFRELGVVSTQVDGEWCNFASLDEEYGEVLLLLIESGLITLEEVTNGR